MEPTRNYYVVLDGNPALENRGTDHLPRLRVGPLVAIVVVPFAGTAMGVEAVAVWAGQTSARQLTFECWTPFHTWVALPTVTVAQPVGVATIAADAGCSPDRSGGSSAENATR